jgi:sporulation protein YlmC with PRC-barrel domain
VTVSGSAALARVLDLPVRHRGITLGRVTDVLLDEEGRPIGLAVLSVAEEPAFLPWPSAEVGADEVRVPYPVGMLSEGELDFYRLATRSLTEELEAGGASMVAGG